MFGLARGHAESGSSAFFELQQEEVRLAGLGYTVRRHQTDAGAGHFDRVREVIGHGIASTSTLHGSTGEAQFDTLPAGGR